MPEVAKAARVIPTATRVECVPFARQLSGIDIHGDAWTWWAKAKSGYRRGHAPEPGAVMVFRRQGGSRGHLAVVSRVLGERLVLVNHANWLNRGNIHESTPVLDVSPGGDWSEVRVWHTPNRQWGRTVYRLYGFVYPSGSVAVRAAANVQGRTPPFNGRVPEPNNPLR